MIIIGIEMNSFRSFCNAEVVKWKELVSTPIVSSLFLSFSLSLFSSRKLRKTTYAAFSLSPCNRIGRATGRLTANSISLDTSRFSIFNSPITSFRPDGRRRIRLHSPGLIRGYAGRGGYAKIEIRWKSL